MEEQTPVTDPVCDGNAAVLKQSTELRVYDVSTLQHSRAHETKQSQASSKCAIEHSLTVIFILFHLYLLLMKHQAYLHVPIGFFFFIINTGCKADKRY